MRNSYRTLTGRRFDLDELSKEERAFLDEVWNLYKKPLPWDEFSRTWVQLGREAIWKDRKIPVGAPLYRICQDLAARLGIAEGRVAPPDYRDRLADLIDARFTSRYEFCKEVGVDQGHLSRVLAGKKHFSSETFFKLLNALGVEIELVNREEVWRHGARPDDAVERLAELEHRIDCLTELQERARSYPPDKRSRLIDQLSLWPHGLDRMRLRIDNGQSFDAALQEELEAASSEYESLASEIARKAREFQEKVAV